MKTLDQSITSVLQPLGFSKRRRVWTRKLGTVTDLINIQVSKGFDCLTINVGVLEDTIYQTVWDQPAPVVVEQLNCTISVRIGYLIGRTDRWWPRSDVDVAEILDAIKLHAIPFLEKVHTPEGMRTWLIDTRVESKYYPPPIMSLAILEKRLGNQERACELASNLLRRANEAWEPSLRKFAAEIGCV